MTLYLDVDGVLADFDGGCTSAGVNNKDTYQWYTKPKSEWTKEQLAVDQAVRDVMLKPGFWLGLNLMPDALDLWNYCLPYKPVLLTAYPAHLTIDEQHRITQEKTDWAEMKLNTNRIICLERKDKVRYARTKSGPFEFETNTLVDDIPQNCAEWAESGGVSVIHKSAEESIKALRGILNA